MRNGKELLIASKDFAEEVRWKSWWCLWSTLTVFLALMVIAISSLPLWICIPASIVCGLVLVRLFIIYHDFMHGSILKNSPVATVVMYIYGLYALSPPNIWKHTHDDHHKNNSKSYGPALGTFPVMTVEGYAKASKFERIGYYVVRHPITMCLGTITSFLWTFSLFPFLQNPKKNWLNGSAVAFHIVLAIVFSMISFQALILGIWVPMMIAGGLGTYLFYAQHNFPGMKRKPEEEWDYVYAALNSSSYMKMNPVMSWFTGNIGYHHVHHLNHKIPFYRLPEAMSAIPELQDPVETSLSPADVYRCVRLKLWDPDDQKMMSFREAASAA